MIFACNLEQTAAITFVLKYSDGRLMTFDNSRASYRKYIAVFKNGEGNQIELTI